uniref:Helix-turn-helix domain protein n=1 Tax=Ackermannviridae sp. ctQad106 TaxID=2826820 RepID=A0A8S5QLU8_9CAUD|nr:MAG TPA: helix-turn-helix domain protein [Ackermannviridae sp. ctQad106]DAW45998.1 MAG TPA: helix-turn-helix domain protein [Ackermannviridae sp.]
MRNVERAKKIAADKGINISFVCREIGKSRGYISQMLTTDRDFPDELLLPVANALGVTVEELTGESEKKEKPNALDGVGLGALLKECEGLSKEELEEAREILDRLDADKLNAALLMLRGLAGKQ